MNKERTISGIKVVVSGETYDEYKGTLQEQLEEKDKEIERLNNIINEAIEYVEKHIITYNKNLIDEISIFDYRTTNPYALLEILKEENANEE